MKREKHARSQSADAKEKVKLQQSGELQILAERFEVRTSHLATKTSHAVTQPAASHETTGAINLHRYGCGAVIGDAFRDWRKGIWYCFSLR